MASVQRPGYQLERPGFEFQQMQKISLLQNIQTASGAHSVQFDWNLVSFSDHEVSQSPPSSAEVKNEWSDTSTPVTCRHGF